MIRQKLIATAAMLLLGLSGVGLISPAQASPISDQVYPAYNAWMQRNYQWWNSLTPRQQALERAIANITWNHQQRTGQLIYPSRQNILAVIRAVGATPSEYQFVAERVAAHYQIARMGRQIDDQIDRTNEFIRCIESGRTYCY